MFQGSSSTVRGPGHGYPHMDTEVLKKVNKNKKLVKKLAKKYDVFLASASLINQIP